MILNFFSFFLCGIRCKVIFNKFIFFHDWCRVHISLSISFLTIFVVVVGNFHEYKYFWEFYIFSRRIWESREIREAEQINCQTKNKRNETKTCPYFDCCSVCRVKQEYFFLIISMTFWDQSKNWTWFFSSTSSNNQKFHQKVVWKLFLKSNKIKQKLGFFSFWWTIDFSNLI